MSYVAISECSDGGSEWRAMPDQYEAILHAFERGDGVMTFTTVDGAEATVRVAMLVSVVFMTDAAIEIRAARVAREKLEDG
jgi:hypothetical protein